MFIQRLVEYAERPEVDAPRPYYRRLAVRYVIELDGRGQPLSAAPVDTADPSKRSTRRGQPHLVPQVQRSVGIKPLLFADNAAYTLGLPREDANAEREAQCHDAYLDLLSRCAGETDDSAVEAVLAFLRQQPVDRLDLGEEYDRGEKITFRVDGRLVVDRRAVRQFWARLNTPGGRGGDIDELQCLVCGHVRPALSRLRGKIKGIPGGQSSGTSLISANENAFESYGLEASQVSPICAECAEAMTVAINRLISDDATHLILGKSVFVFWTREPTQLNLGNLMTQPDPGEVRQLLASVFRPPSAEVDANRFYGALLSAAGSRAVLRDWIETTVDVAQGHLARWFAGQRIVGAWGEEPRPLGLYSLAAATERELRDVPSPTLQALLGCAVQGRALPPGLLYRVVQRTRAQQGVDRNHAALIKLCIQSRRPAVAIDPREEDPMTHLDRANTSPAYLCGRLLATLESVQYWALGRPNATIVDRYYGTASSAPASVFGTLMTNAQAHLSKLRRVRPGLHVVLQRELEETLGALPAFPRTLSLDDQALFALGYYHQRAASRARPGGDDENVEEGQE